MQTCFHCRQTGHLVAECPMAQSSEVGVGNCYKCGSSQHTTKNCKSKQNSKLIEYFWIVLELQQEVWLLIGKGHGFVFVMLGSFRALEHDLCQLWFLTKMLNLYNAIFHPG